MESLNHLLKFAKLEKVFILKTTPLNTCVFVVNTYQICTIKLIWAVAHVSQADTEILIYNDFQYKAYSVHYELFLGPCFICCNERLD